jgi:hypothetical protein
MLILLGPSNSIPAKSGVEFDMEFDIDMQLTDAPLQSTHIVNIVITVSDSQRTTNVDIYQF